jgi:hypothetical protein
MRKTITLPPSIETAVREYQMLQMRTRKRDVSFTESLVSLVSLGLATFELMAESAADSASITHDALFQRWIAIDRADEAHMPELLDTSYDMAAEWIRKFSDQSLGHSEG